MTPAAFFSRRLQPDEAKVSRPVLREGSGGNAAPLPVQWPRRNHIDNPVPKWHHVSMEHVMEEPRKRITARVSDSVRDTLEQAAELLGATVNQFVVQTAYVEAQRVIERESVIRLSQKDAHKVLVLLDSPPKPSKRLKEAVKAFKGTVRA
jgi:uncharacterized protein (DUF1778 family)